MTLRATHAVRCLRSARVFPAVRRALAVSSHDGFRIVHFSVQDDHVHLLVEGETRKRLSGGLRGLAIRIARAVNRVLGRRGAVWGDRYHARALSTPREVRHSLVYVLMNRKKHNPAATGLDPCSSARWFDGWRKRPVPWPEDPPPVMRPRTWLAVVGWRRHGLVGVEERPRWVSSGVAAVADHRTQGDVRALMPARRPVGRADAGEAKALRLYSRCTARHGC